MYAMSLQSGSVSRSLLVAGAIVAIAFSLLSLLRGSRLPEPDVNTGLYAGLGAQAAEKTLSLVERGGSVLIIEPRLFGHAAPGMEAMISAYETALREVGVSVAAREVVTLPGPADEPREEPWTLSAMGDKYYGVGAVASFAGLPSEPAPRGERLPMLVFCPEPVDARALLQRGEADIVVAPRQTDGEPSGQTSDVYAILTVGDLD